VSIDFLGTAGGDALAVGIESLVIKSQQIQKEQKSELPKIILRITDGYSNKGINPEAIIPYLKEYEISVWALGIGDTNTVIGKDHQGSPVTTPIDFDVLEKIAQRTDGFFVKAQGSEQIQDFFDQAESKLISYTEIAQEKTFYHINVILIPILIILLLLIIGIRIGLAVRGGNKQM
jgi:hypothetical protein